MFLESLFAGKPESDFILVWVLDGKSSTWYPSPERIDPAAYTGDTYFGVGTAAERGDAYHRCPADAVAGIGALWLDIDIAGPGHTKALLPATQVAALTLLTLAFPTLQPSYIIDSGHGLQAYWLLDQWHAIANTNREATKQLLIDFNAFWRAASAKAGYDADSVCDLARVMRLPGTKNCKVPDDIRPVVALIADPELRYSWARLRFYIPASQSSPKPIRSEPEPIHSASDSVGHIDTSDLHACFKDQWEGLKLSDKRFEQTWNLARPDLKDQSPSSYEMSLGRLAINAGCSDQFAAELMKQFRRQHDLKNKDHARAGAIRKIHETPSGFTHLGTVCLELARYDSTPTTYQLKIADQAGSSGGAIDGITDQKKFRNTSAASCGILPSTQKGANWDELINALLRIITHNSAGPESTEQGQCLQWIEGYLQGATIHNDKANAKIAGEPWTEDGHIYISGAAFRRWIAFNLGDKVESKQLAIMLKNIGAIPTKGAWKLPNREEKSQ